MKVLDLYCGGGGASVGMKDAGVATLFGVDILAQPQYPFWFIQADVRKLTADFIAQFDFA